MLARTISHCRREGCDGVGFRTSPSEKKVAVASVKHFSIIALIVLFFRPLREDRHMQTEKRSKERDVCYGR